MKYAGISDRGKIRDKNEDRYLIWENPPLYLFAVADGMGGHAAGEVASSLAMDSIRRYLSSSHQEILFAAEKNECDRHLSLMMKSANKAILAEGMKRPASNGMGTTLTVVLFFNGKCWLGHVGDSRAYLLNETGIACLTQDHTLVTQLLHNGQISEDETHGHPQRHILTRALGTEDNAEYDLIQTNLTAGQRLLLCSDGLYSMMTDEEIKEITETGSDPQDVVKKLTGLANERGGTDNITAVLVII